MRTQTFVVALALAVVATAAIGSTRAAAPTSYGKGVTLSTSTPLARVLENPASFEGKTVRIEGVVTAVCQEMGCWMALGEKDAPGTPTVMVKVDDGVIVFPVTAKGRKAAAQGVVQRIAGNDREGNEAAREKASAVPVSKVPSTDTWLLKATGAVVY